MKRRFKQAFLVKTSRLQEIGTCYAAVQGQEIGREARLLVSVSDGWSSSEWRSGVANLRHSDGTLRIGEDPISFFLFRIN
jgi:hypothetical protein